jgi:NAD(P)-dependent dehydrogenase (short-subunit alcohol dehydrogenase family)
MPEALRDLPQVSCLRIDITDEVGLKDAAAAVGGQVDILINTARAQADAGDSARTEMEVHYFGLLNLARHFSPAFSERAAATKELCPAWVNVLSVSALPGSPSWGTYGASMAAARSLSRSLRTRLREAGARVVTVYPGPLDDDQSERYQMPKLGASAFAKSIVGALQSGVEEVFPGEVAQTWSQVTGSAQGAASR